MMLAVDLMADPSEKRAFDSSVGAGERVFRSCVERGLIVRPVGDRIVLSPPLILDRAQVDQMAETLSFALDELHQSLAA